jgi:hypothetical protein
MKLNQSSVIFDQHAHTYTLNGKTLSGVTSLLNRQLFKDKYTGISEELLAKAASRGSLIHETIELVEFVVLFPFLIGMVSHGYLNFESIMHHFNWTLQCFPCIIQTETNGRSQ